MHARTTTDAMYTTFVIASRGSSFPQRGWRVDQFRSRYNKMTDIERSGANSLTLNWFFVLSVTFFVNTILYMCLFNGGSHISNRLLRSNLPQSFPPCHSIHPLHMDLSTNPLPLPLSPPSLSRSVLGFSHSPLDRLPQHPRRRMPG